MMALAFFDTDLSDASVASRKPARKAPEYSSTSSSAPPPSSGKARLMVVTLVAGPTRRFRFKKTFMVLLEHLTEGVVAQHPNLPISGYGVNTAAAMEEFGEMFELQWEALVDRPVERLTHEAYLVREELLAIAVPL